jgi:hypothetical protein
VTQLALTPGVAGRSVRFGNWDFVFWEAEFVSFFSCLSES